MFYQQGDVIIEETEEIISGKKLTHKILAYGEATGHCHQISEGDVELFEKGDGTLLMKVNSKEAVLTHDEHAAITIPKPKKGINYIIRKVLEYDHFAEEVKEVQD